MFTLAILRPKWNWVFVYGNRDLPLDGVETLVLETYSYGLVNSIRSPLLLFFFFYFITFFFVFQGFTSATFFEG